VHRTCNNYKIQTLCICTNGCERYPSFIVTHLVLQIQHDGNTFTHDLHVKLKNFTLAITIIVTVKISRPFLFSTYVTVQIRCIFFLLQYLQLLLKCNVLKHLLNLLHYGIAFKGFYHTQFT
jgi:hypothetical protein